MLANFLVACLGLCSLIRLYTHVLAKLTTYVSNVVAPSKAGSSHHITSHKIRPARTQGSRLPLGLAASIT